MRFLHVHWKRSGDWLSSVIARHPLWPWPGVLQPCMQMITKDISAELHIILKPDHSWHLHGSWHMRGTCIKLSDNPVDDQRMHMRMHNY